MTIEEVRELKLGDVVEITPWGVGAVVKAVGHFEDKLMGFMSHFAEADAIVLQFSRPVGGWDWANGKNCMGFYKTDAHRITLISRASKHPLIKTEFLEGIEL